MKQAGRIKAIYRFAEGAWLCWATSALIALPSLGSGNGKAPALSVMFSIMYAVMGVYVLMEGQAGFELAFKSDRAAPSRFACFVFYSAPLAAALAAGALFVCRTVEQPDDSSPAIFHISFNAAMLIATTAGCVCAKRFPNGPSAAKDGRKRLLRAGHFYVALILLLICIACECVLIATRTRTEEAGTLRDAAMSICTLGAFAYLALMFRPSAYHLAKSPEKVMDDADRPALWLRALLIYTAQGGVICAAVNGLVLILSNAAKGSLTAWLLTIGSTTMLEAFIISACIVAFRYLRENFLPHPRQEPTAQRPAWNPPPAPPKPKPPEAVSAPARRQQLDARAKELEQERAATSAVVSAPSEPSRAVASEQYAGRADATLAQAPLSPTPAELSQRKALEAELIAIVRNYREKRVQQHKAYLARRDALKPQAKSDAARLKAAAALRETKRDEAAIESFAAQTRADEQRRLRALRGERLAEESKAAARPVPKTENRETFETLLERAAARLEPRGAALGTVGGQQALFCDLATLLPGLEALNAALPTAGEKSGPALPEAVGGLLDQVCTALIQIDPDEAIARWNGLAPEALTRGWRALKIFGGISTASAMFEAVASRLLVYMRARSDCVEWLQAHTGKGE